MVSACLSTGGVGGFEKGKGGEGGGGRRRGEQNNFEAWSRLYKWHLNEI